MGAEQKATRRRGHALDEAIRTAAWAELAETGWAEFSIGGVAKRCATAKAVIYRRWPHRLALVQDMLDRAVTADISVAESSGSLRSDLLEFLHTMSHFVAGPFGEAVRGVLVEQKAARHTALFGPDVPTAIRNAVDAAVARGDLAAQPAVLAMNVGQALVIHELLHVGSPPDVESLVLIVDEIWLPALQAAPLGA